MNSNKIFISSLCVLDLGVLVLNSQSIVHSAPVTIAKDTNIPSPNADLSTSNYRFIGGGDYIAPPECRYFFSNSIFLVISSFFTIVLLTILRLIAV